jgi:hypothetical protein
MYTVTPSPAVQKFELKTLDVSNNCYALM